jgi:hypothetical protein
VKRAARPVAVLAAATIAACFSKPGAPRVGDGDGGTTGSDGGGTNSGSDAGTDGGTGTCTSQPVDTFDSGTSCGAIGSAYGPAGAVSRINNQLRIDGAGSGGGCFSLAAFDFSHGTSFKIVQAAASADANTTHFYVYNGANMAEGVMVDLITSVGVPSIYDVVCLSGTGQDEQTYDPVAQLYWKFEVAQSATGTDVRTYYSADGTSWTDTGVSCPWSSTTTAKIDIGVAPSGMPLSAPALFDDFNVNTCVP